MLNIFPCQTLNCNAVVFQWKSMNIELAECSLCIWFLVMNEVHGMVGVKVLQLKVSIFNDIRARRVRNFSSPAINAKPRGQDSDPSFLIDQGAAWIGRHELAKFALQMFRLLTVVAAK